MLQSLREEFLQAVTQAPVEFPFQLNTYVEQSVLERQGEALAVGRQVLERHCREMGILREDAMEVDEGHSL